MACGVPPRQEGIVLLTTAPLAFPPSAGGGPTGVRHLLSPLQPFCLWLSHPRCRHDVLCRRLHIAAPSIVEAVARTNQLCSLLVRFVEASNWPLLPRNPAWPCSPLTPTSPKSTPKCESVMWWLHRTPKLLVVTPDTTSPSALDLVKQASMALNVMKASAGSSWGITTKTLVATYKDIMRPIPNYAAPIWFTQVSSSHLD